MSGLLVPFAGVFPTIAPSAFVAPGAVVAGDVVIGADSGVWFNCVLRGDTDVIRIGERTNIQDGTVIHTSSSGLGAIVGDDVTIGHQALIHACRLESGCFVGMGPRFSTASWSSRERWSPPERSFRLGNGSEAASFGPESPPSRFDA